jgi:hypothetical protein
VLTGVLMALLALEHADNVMGCVSGRLAVGTACSTPDSMAHDQHEVWRGGCLRDFKLP